ncbi:MAG: RpiB/LacA/LacB family sugar-phosphate isomerase [Patescibacteria group bacterium]
MIIYIGADHRGFELKEYLKNILKIKGYEVADAGAVSPNENDDFNEFAEKVAKKVSEDYEHAKGILICGSGVGMDIIANKFPKVRSALVFNADQAYDSRNDDDVNVLSLAADHIKPEDAKNIVITWLGTPFSGEERFKRRLERIVKLEQKNFHPLDEE